MLQILSTLNVFLGLLILKVCLGIFRSAKNKEVKKSLKLIMTAVGIEILGNAVTAILGTPWGVLRDLLEFTVLCFVAGGIYILGGYYGSK